MRQCRNLSLQLLCFLSLLLLCPVPDEALRGAIFIWLEHSYRAIPGGALHYYLLRGTTSVCSIRGHLSLDLHASARHGCTPRIQNQKPPNALMGCFNKMHPATPSARPPGSQEGCRRQLWCPRGQTRLLLGHSTRRVWAGSDTLQSPKRKMSTVSPRHAPVRLISQLACGYRDVHRLALALLHVGT